MAKQRKRISDIITIEKFHEEVTTEPIFRDDILDNEIVVFDISDSFINKKAKYPKDTMIILMCYAEDEKEDKYCCFVSGDVVIDQLSKLKAEPKTIPSEEGILMKLIKTSNYYKFE